MKGIRRPSHKYLLRWSCDLLRRCAKVARSIWDILGYGHTGPLDIVRPPALGEVWVVVDHRGWIVRDRAMLYDARRCDTRDLEYRTIVARRRATSLYVMRRPACVYHIFTCSLVASWSCDVLRRRTRSHNHHTTVIVFRCWLQQTIIVKSYDLVRLSYHGCTMSYDVVLVISDCPDCLLKRIFYKCDHKTKIAISYPSRGQS